MNDTRRGAYRNFIAPVVTDGVNAEVDYLSRINTNGAITINGAVGNRNTLYFKKRHIKYDHLTIDFSAGKENYGKVYFRSKTQYLDFNHAMTIGDRNMVDLRSVENPVDILIGSDNYIDGSFNAGDITVGDGNILIDFNGIIKSGTKAYPSPKLGSLMFDTRVTDYSGEGSTYITVADVSLMEFGGEVKFGTVGAAFARKTITKIIGNKVFIDTPLTAKESTYPNALVFNSLPEDKPEYTFYTSGITKELSKRLPINTSAILALREVVIGGTFNTKIFFVRSSDNVAIIKDLSPSVFPSGTEVYAKGYHPFDARNINVISIDQDNSLAEVDSLEGVHIGRVFTNNINDEFIVTGFFDSKIIFDSVLDLTVGNISSLAIDVIQETKNIELEISEDISASNLMIPVVSTNGISIGDTVYFDGFSEPRTVVSKTSGTIELNISMLPSEVNDIVAYGSYIVDRATDRRGLIDDARENIHTYLFGGL